jgi:hypothetical protein
LRSSWRDAALDELAEKHRLFHDLGEGTMEEILIALDAATLAHLATTFKWASQPPKR